MGLEMFKYFLNKLLKKVLMAKNADMMKLG